MKALYFSVIILILSALVSSCDTDSTVYGPPLNQYSPSDSAHAYFLPEATDFAVSYLTGIHSPDTNLIVIPDSIINRFLYPLAALYDSRAEYPALDTVINHLGIHKNLIWSVRTEVVADTAESWVMNAVNHIAPTGNATVDSLVALYNLEIDGEVLPILGRAALTISHTPLNSRALARTFLPIEGVYGARPSLVMYFEADLEFELYSDASMVQFILYGIPTSETWTFSVDGDYLIEYLGSLEFESPPNRP